LLTHIAPCSRTRLADRSLSGGDTFLLSATADRDLMEACMGITRRRCHFLPFEAMEVPETFASTKKTSREARSKPRCFNDLQSGADPVPRGRNSRMNNQNEDRPAATSLRVLGISFLEELLYRELLRKPGSTARTLAGRLDLTVERVNAGIDQLERNGFSTHAPEAEPRLYAAPPDIAIESLLHRKQNELLSARLAISDFQREQGSPSRGSPVVEIIDAAPAAQIQPYAQCHIEAIDEVLCLVRPPFLVSSPTLNEDPRAEARNRGVRYRNIVHPETFLLPGWPEILRSDIEAGEEVRMLPDFPFKMIVTDRRLGLLPLNIDEPRGAMLLLRRSAVLDALCELFETLWAKAVPVSFTSAGEVVFGAASSYPHQLHGLISLLASGANDKVAAERLGMSERTLMRRVELLYQTLNARSRFQAGWLAALDSAAAP
jgi:sugar-specific transcriptional regulator TrmB